MASITSLTGSDGVTTANSMTKINTNFANLNSDKIETSALSTDDTFTAASDSKIPSQLAVRSYVDSGGNQNASETTRGIAQEATDAQVTAGTATGSTGAKLFVTPAKLNTLLSTSPVVRTYLNAASPATWTKPTGLKYVVVEVQAAGGGGGGVNAGSGGVSAGAGGAGGYSRKTIAAATLGATETVTIGAKGGGGNAGDNNGTAGGNSSFGSHATANGGALGGKGSSAGGGAGGTAASGDINITGQDGAGGSSGTSVKATAGGSSLFGRGGLPSTALSGGSAAFGYGGGGGGAANISATAAGGNGSDGIVIVTEYYV